MAENIVVNNAGEIPFSSILADLLKTNVEQKPNKMRTFNNLRGVVTIEVTDIEATVYLIFSGGKVEIEKGVEEKPHIIIRADSEKVMGLNFINIKWGLPYYFDKAGRTVIKHLLSGQIKIKGMLLHPIILTRLTKVMSVM
ncbi:MAG: SCP2 sterol-binding domain-containing protein [Deltaproteobacteria bacterium]|nr:SCP2 sterol-binding domain-containing protein [Deltaproteobacteria bacterium]MBL7205136.1 SCP2 sterol-binding domain-containing protein [Desulfobacteraceae bacterium]